MAAATARVKGVAGLNETRQKALQGRGKKRGNGEANEGRVALRARGCGRRAARLD